MDTTLTHEPIATAVAPTVANDARLDFFTFGPEAMQAMSALDQRVARSDLERSLVELVRIRVSQINGARFAWTAMLQRRASTARRTAGWRPCKHGATCRFFPSAREQPWNGGKR